ncbi:MAG: hypothetical protein IJD43_09725 [Thermoguttaceae bacterium]|nr:hypothetical protein [Thermoguttaceae bacterium]
MNRHVQLWEALTMKIRELLPVFTVRRTYDPLAELSEIQTGTPLGFLTLTAKSRERLDSRRIFDVYEFELWLVRDLPADDPQSAMDEYLEYLDRVGDVFSLKVLKLEMDGEPVKVFFPEESETLGNEAFEDSEYAQGRFSARIGFTAKTERIA